MSTVKESSKRDWISNDQTDHLRLGCLQRIADATELMAKSYRELQSERDRYYGWFTEEQKAKWKLERRVVALRGVITRMKKAGR
jgi:hypothetical protein